MDRGDPAFPRPTAEWWFGCPKENHFSKVRGTVTIFLFYHYHHDVQGLGSSSDYVVTLLNTQPSPEASDADIDYTGYDDYYDGSEPRH